jgi:hypothetical protein
MNSSVKQSIQHSSKLSSWRESLWTLHLHLLLVSQVLMKLTYSTSILWKANSSLKLSLRFRMTVSLYLQQRSEKSRSLRRTWTPWLKIKTWPILKLVLRPKLQLAIKQMQLGKRYLEVWDDTLFVISPTNLAKTKTDGLQQYGRRRCRLILSSFGATLQSLIWPRLSFCFDQCKLKTMKKLHWSFSNIYHTSASTSALYLTLVTYSWSRDSWQILWDIDSTRTSWSATLMKRY